MEKIHVKTAVIIALIATVFGSLVAPSLVTAQTGTAVQTASAVFSKVGGYGWVELGPGIIPIISIDLPFIGANMFYKVECGGYLTAQYAVCNFAIGVDDSGVDIYTDWYYGDRLSSNFFTGVHAERVFRLGPGAHSFHFYGGIIIEGDDPDADCNYMSITVTVYTHGALEEPVAEYEINLDSANLYEP